VKVPTKAPTGIAGFDDITGGGLPRGRSTLLVGRSGTGKTVLALQFLVHGLAITVPSSAHFCSVNPTGSCCSSNISSSAGCQHYRFC